MKLIIKSIPNFITSLNIVSGVFSIICIINNDYKLAIIAILFAGLFDFLDGLSARLLKAYSEFGKQLDSLADAISFGVAPGFLSYSYLNNILQQQTNYPEYLAYLGLSIILFALYRLARFNASESNSTTFNGMAVPITAIFVYGFVWFLTQSNAPIVSFFSNPLVYISIIMIINVLMVSNLPMFSLKLKNFSFKENYIQYVFVIISIILFSVFRLFALPLIVSLYIVLSVINLIINKLS